MKLRASLVPAAALLLLLPLVPLLSQAPALAAPIPSLGTAGTFAVLGGSTVTNTGLTTLIGDLGVSPGTAITGFPPGVFSGVEHVNDAVAGQAQSDVTTAYNNAAAQPCNADLSGQDLGGKTLTPGVYCFTSSAQLTGLLTLDGQGNPGSVFIFKIGSTLTTASNSGVAFINTGSAQPCSSNIFWQIGSSATLGTNTSFTGNILALASITLNTGSSTNGGLYARTGAVTLDTNSIVRTTQVCSAATPTLAPTGTATVIAATPTTAPTGTATVIAASTPTTAPTGTATVIAASTPTIAPTGTATLMPVATSTRAPGNTPTLVPTGTATVIIASTPTLAPTGTVILTRASTPTIAPSGTATVIRAATPTIAPSSTVLLIRASTPTLVPSGTASLIIAATPTAVPTRLAASTDTATAVTIQVALSTNTPISTATLFTLSLVAATATGTPTVTATAIAAATRIPMHTATPTGTSTGTPVRRATASATTSVTGTALATSVASTTAIVRYHDVTRVHTTVRVVVRYHDVTRVHTRVRVVVRYRDVTRVRTTVRVVVRYRDVTRVRTTVRTVVRDVTVVRHITRVIIRHRTVIVTKITYRYYHQPNTGRSAGRLTPWHGPIPAAEARLSIARLGIRWAPIWARSFVANPDGSLRYDIVPAYGVTRFADSAPLGGPGLALMSGHDDIHGSIFRHLDALRTGDMVVVAHGARTYRYVVRSVNVVTPDDVRLLNAAYSSPTLALISCTPYGVDTHRVVVIAQMR